MMDALRNRYGPLPGWAWGLIAALLAGAYFWYRNRQQQQAQQAAATQQAANNQSSNLGTVPVSNLQTTAQPMPVQLGDTFVNTGQTGASGTSSYTGTPNTTLISGTNNVPSGSLQPAMAPQASPATNVTPLPNGC